MKETYKYVFLMFNELINLKLFSGDRDTQAYIIGMN